MKRLIGTHARAVRAPIISQGDDLQKIVVDSILDGNQAGSAGSGGGWPAGRPLRMSGPAQTANPIPANTVITSMLRMSPSSHLNPGTFEPAAPAAFEPWNL